MIDNTLAGYSASSFQINVPAGFGAVSVKSFKASTDDVTLNLAGNPFRTTGGTSGIDDPGLVVGTLPTQPAALLLRNLTGGAPVDFTTSAACIADQPTSGGVRPNILRVGDASTRLVVSGAAFIGRRGNKGSIAIDGGGDAVIGGTLSVADQLGSVGAVNIIGPGSTLLYGSLGSGAGIGVNGSGSMTISAGGTAASAARLGFVSIGTQTGGTAQVTIDGAGSVWNAQQSNLSLGHAGDVVVGITSGGLLLTDTTTDLYVSRFRESQSTVTLAGAGSLWRELTAPVRIGPVGTIDVGAGTALECPAMVVTEGGLLTGEGVVRALTPGGLINLSNGGTISPRAAVGGVGVLTINGSLTQSASRDGVTTAGTLAADLAGTAPGQADRIDLGGSATLSGALRVRLVNGFDPPIGSRFTVLTAAGGITGRFDVAYFPGLAGRFFRIDYPVTAERVVNRVDVVVEAQGERGAFVGSGYSAPGAPSAAALGNLNADAFPDLALTIPDATNPETNPGQVAVLINSGVTGNAWNGFVPSSQVTFNTGRLPSGVVIARLRGNAQPNDLAVACAGDNAVQTFSNSGAAVFASAGTVSSGGLRPLDIDAADFTGDGVPDLAVANYGDINPPPSQQLPDRGNARVLNNNGSGTFTPADTLVTGWYPRSLALADFDGDGRSDIATADFGTSEVSVFLRPPGGGSGFTPRTRYVTPGPPAHVEPGGLDNPKDLNDLAMVIGTSIATPQNIAVMINGDTGNGTFNPPVSLDVGGVPSDLTFVDLENDADDDIAVIVQGATPGTSSVRLLRNNTPTGATVGVVLALEPTPVSTNNPTLILSGDVDNDGLEDLLTINADATLLRPGTSGAINGAPEPDRGNPGPQRVAVARATPPPPPCVGDFNGDNAVNTADLVAFLGRFGQAVTPGSPGDLNNDGVVNTADLVAFLGRFGQSCPQESRRAPNPRRRRLGVRTLDPVESQVALSAYRGRASSKSDTIKVGAEGFEPS